MMQWPLTGHGLYLAISDISGKKSGVVPNVRVRGPAQDGDEYFAP
jgi:hypothetical protein